MSIGRAIATERRTRAGYIAIQHERRGVDGTREASVELMLH